MLTCSYSQGVMTAQKYLDTRAKAVYETWGRQIPGKISFFSRSGSSSKYNIPLVSLPGVDDVSKANCQRSVIGENKETTLLLLALTHQ